MMLLRDKRDECKKLMKQARTEGDEEMAEYYNNLQDSIKITMNSFYGVMTSKFYRFTNDMIGGSITAFARQNIHRVINGLTEMKYNVIYSDTDSVFFLADTKNKEETIKIGKAVAEKFSVGEAELEFEKIMDPLFAIGKKKRYCGRIIWPEKSFIVRGFQNRRGDSFDYVSKSLDQVFDLIGEKEYKSAGALIKSKLKTLSAQEVPKEELVISKTVKEESVYDDANKMANVQAARKLRALGLVVPANTKVDYIVTDAVTTPQVVEPYHPSLQNNMTPDWEYYKERFITTFIDIADVLGISELELRKNQQQTSLLSF